MGTKPMVHNHSFFIPYQTLQYGPRKCERDVDGSSPHREGQEEVQTSEQRQIHF